MKRPVRYSRRRLRYTARIDRASFIEWSECPAGRSVLEPVASQVRFALFGRMRSARRRIWRRLTEAARSEPIVAAVQREINTYLARLDTLAYAHDLPRTAVGLRRLVAVPRLFANAITERQMEAWLEPEAAFGTAIGGKPLREWFIRMVIDGVETAIVSAQPSPARPLPAGKEWVVVGVNDRFEWRVPFDGPAWPGHYYVLELTREPVTRAIRKAAAEAIARLDASVMSLPPVDRSEILRHAGRSLEQLLVEPRHRREGDERIRADRRPQASGAAIQD